MDFILSAEASSFWVLVAWGCLVQLEFVFCTQEDINPQGANELKEQELWFSVNKPC